MHLRQNPHANHEGRPRRSPGRRRVVLFNPSAVKGVGEGRTPPVGLLMAATHLHGRYRVEVVDQRVEPRWESRLRGLLGEGCVCLGVTALTGRQITNGLAASRLAKQAGCPVVWGGVHASILPQQTLAHPLVDYVVQGEGEVTFRELVDALAGAGTVRGIPGVWATVDGAAVCGGERPFVTLESLPPVPWELIDLRRYVWRGPHGPTLVLFSSRGCPQRCTFCFNHSVNRSRWRAFSPEVVLAEVERLLAERPELTHLEFWDDDFFVHRGRARRIAEGFRDRFPAISWSVLGAHVRDLVRMDDDYLACLRKSGLRSVLIGAESGSRDMLRALRKNFTPEELLRANRRLGAFGIRPTYSFMSGFPDETEDHVRETVSLIFRLRKDNPAAVTGNVKPFICYPGTALYERAGEMGLVSPGRLEDWAGQVWQRYDELDVPWTTRARRRFLVHLYYYTLLMNPEYMFIQSDVYAALSSVLRPLTEWRVRHLRFGWPFEVWLMKTAEKVAQTIA